MDKARKLQWVGKVKVAKTVRVGEKGAGESKGVIAGIPLSVGMKELVDNLKVRNSTVRNAKRMTRGVEKKETETVLIEFEAEVVPKELFYGFIKYNVREFVPKPLRCFNCQEYGHIAKVCTGRRRCARCGEDHEYGNCGANTRPKCCNCGGDHSVAFWGCEAMKKAASVQQIRVKENVSYAEAVKRVEKEKQSDRQEWRKEQVVALEVEKKVREEKKKLVTFIAGVINATADVKSKTERIQIIIKAAVHHLELKGLKWEDIREELSNQASQESQGTGHS